MKKENKPIISDEFLDQLYGEPAEEESEDYKNNG